MFKGLLKTIFRRPSENLPEGDGTFTPKKPLSEKIKDLIMFDFSSEEEYDDNP